MEFRLGDFSADPRVLILVAMAIVVGAGGAGSAWLLIKLIALATNLSWFGRFSFVTVSPANAVLGPWTVAVPALGGLAIGLMARFGSEKIRGHGIPEAIEAILIGGSRMRSESRGAQAAVVGDLDRHRRPVRRRRTDHHDRRRARLAVRAMLPSERRRAEDPAGRRRRRRHDRDLRHAARRGAAGGRAAAVRMEAAQLHPGGRPPALVSIGLRPLLFGAAPLFPLRAACRTCRGGACSPARPSASSAACNRDCCTAPALRRRGSVRAAAGPLDVVAADRRRLLSASAA